MLKATSTTLAAAGIQERPDTLLADSGYWSIANLTTIPDAPELYIPPGRHARQGKPRKDRKPSASKSDGLRAAMKAKLTSEDGKGPLRLAEGVRRASLRPDQGWPWCPPAAAPRPPGVRGGSGSCCAAPTTCSSCGATPAASRHPRRSPPEPRGTATPPHTLAGSGSCSVETIRPTVSRSAVQVAGCGIETSPFSNGLDSVKSWIALTIVVMMR
jgi:hypothetical protein